MNKNTFAPYFRYVCAFAMQAHDERNTKDRFRRFDGQTPFFIHPVGMAMSILNDNGIPMFVRAPAAVVALLHDVLEDTEVDEDGVREFHRVTLEAQGLEEYDLGFTIDEVLAVVNRLTTETSQECQDRYMRDPDSANLIEVLVRAVDITDNIVTFPIIKAVRKLDYMRLLAARMPEGSVNTQKLLNEINRLQEATKV